MLGIGEELQQAIDTALTIARGIEYPEGERHQSELEQAYERIGRIVCQKIEDWGYQVQS